MQRDRFHTQHKVDCEALLRQTDQEIKRVNFNLKRMVSAVDSHLLEQTTPVDVLSASRRETSLAKERASRLGETQTSKKSKATIVVRFKKKEEIVLHKASNIELWQEDDLNKTTQLIGEKGSARSNGYEKMRQRVDEISNNEEMYEQFMRYMRKVKRSRLQSVTGVVETPLPSTIKKNISNGK